MVDLFMTDYSDRFGTWINLDRVASISIGPICDTPPKKSGNFFWESNAVRNREVRFYFDTEGVKTFVMPQIKLIELRERLGLTKKEIPPQKKGIATAKEILDAAINYINVYERPVCLDELVEGVRADLPSVARKKRTRRIINEHAVHAKDRSYPPETRFVFTIGYNKQRYYVLLDV